MGLLGLRSRTIPLLNVLQQLEFPALSQKPADEELENLVQQVAPGSGISAYLESDNELPTCYSLLTEQQLLEAIVTSHDAMEIESDDENEMEKEDTPGEGERLNKTTTLKSFKDVLDSVQNISAFLIHRGEFKVANEFSLLGDKVGEVAVQRRSTQSRLEQGNVIADAINS